jgi:murein DD-endopeptidase MepM/ murein hydrolase activator NlpD
MIVKDAESSPKSIKIPTLLYRLLQLLAILVIAAVIIETITYARLWSYAQDRTRLLAENAELKEYSAKVAQLEQNLRANRAMLHKMTELAGVNLAEFGWLGYEIGDSAEASVLPQHDWPLPSPDSEPHEMPAGLPVLGWVSRTFRPDDDNPKMRHFGIDIAVRQGSGVLATADGRVTFADWDSTFGWQVILDHGGGMETVYGHNDTLLVSAGQEICFGDTIALSGNTGLSSAPHVHYEIRQNGSPVNPESYLELPE